MECKAGRRCYIGIAQLHLIETLWNVKLPWSADKEKKNWNLIETLWNVKASWNESKYPELRDLIETLWNVKKITVSYADEGATDLIETLRNVKYVLNDLHYSHYIKFNRDIVECKIEIMGEVEVICI